MMDDVNVCSASILPYMQDEIVVSNICVNVTHELRKVYTMVDIQADVRK